jgi:hypothetical protein
VVAITEVIAPPPGELFSETNDNSVAILLTYGTVRVLLAGDAEASEGYMVGPLPGVHTRRCRVARHDRWRHPRLLEAANLTSTFFTPIFTPTHPNIIRLRPTRPDEGPWKFQSVRASSDINRHPDTH